ncbi:hypothetical protein CCACVL1_00936, partial [Corchorus capsularis]
VTFYTIVRPTSNRMQALKDFSISM